MNQTTFVIQLSRSFSEAALARARQDIEEASSAELKAWGENAATEIAASADREKAYLLGYRLRLAFEGEKGKATRFFSHYEASDVCGTRQAIEGFRDGFQGKSLMGTKSEPQERLGNGHTIVDQPDFGPKGQITYKA